MAFRLSALAGKNALNISAAAPEKQLCADGYDGGLGRPIAAMSLMAGVGRRPDRRRGGGAERTGRRQEDRVHPWELGVDGWLRRLRAADPQARPTWTRAGPRQIEAVSLGPRDRFRAHLPAHRLSPRKVRMRQIGRAHV